ncbi:MAG: polysaccharide pyruvyl transferase family protein [Kiritimatiellaeota bacterium]|nr:polysaccharide pyruvyl transferase family protein [Kiritimatiellota bacterium]
MTPTGLYYCRSSNFGDALNPLIFERVLGVPVRYAKKRRATLCGIGSILDGLMASPSFASILTRTCLSPIHVFSSGFTFASQKLGVRPLRKMVVHAVRGQQTRQQLVGLGVMTAEQPVAYGDAGLFAPFLLERDVPKKYSCGIIPHVAERDCAEIAALAGTVRGSVVIDFEQPPLEVLEQIASCEVIVSSAMHGLIAADALGIPNIWMKASDRIIGGRNKFDDYYSAYAGYAKEPIAVHDVMHTLDQCSCPEAGAVTALQDGLRQAFSGWLNTHKG